MALRIPKNALEKLGLLLLFILVGRFLAVVMAGGVPKSQDLHIAYVEGDIFLPNLRAEVWQLGEAKNCQIASRTTVPPDKRGDLLLCGNTTQFAWGQTWLRADIRTAIYEASNIENVKFHGIGNSGQGRHAPRWWQCKRMPEGIDCE